MARPDRLPDTPEATVPDGPSDRWILSHHDAWSRATLAPLFVSLAHGTLDSEFFSRWLLDRVFIARALVPACDRVRHMLGRRGIEFPIHLVAQEEAEFLEQYALAHGFDVTSRWRLSYDAGRVIELIYSATEDPADRNAAKVAAQQAAASAGAGMATATAMSPLPPARGTVAFVPPLGGGAELAAGFNDPQRATTAHVAIDGMAAPLAAPLLESPIVQMAPALGLAPGSHVSLCVAVAATWSFLFASWQAHSLSRRNDPISGSGVHPTHSEMRHFLSREEALVRIVETQGVLDSLLNVAGNPADLNKAQKTFEELLLRRIAVLDAALESGAKEGKAPLCVKCGRKGHIGDRCTFKSHV